MAAFEIIQADLTHVQELLAFGITEVARTFQHLYSPEDWAAYVADGYSEEKYRSWITDSAQLVLIAKSTASGEIVGCAINGPCSLPLENFGVDATPCLEIYKLYIHPSFKGCGVAQALMKLSTVWAKEQNKQDKVFLGVWSENHRALRFYEKEGFVRVGEHGYKVGNQVDVDYILQWKPSTESGAENT